MGKFVEKVHTRDYGDPPHTCYRAWHQESTLDASQDPLETGRKSCGS